MESGHEDDFQFQYVYAYALIRSGKAGGRPSADGETGQGKELRRGMAACWFRAILSRRNGTRLRRSGCCDCIESEAAGAVYDVRPGAVCVEGLSRAPSTSFQAALRADPMDFVANRDLGAMRLKANDIESARPLLELALQLHSDDPLTRFEIAKLNDQTGKYAEAAVILEDLVRTDPNWLDPHWLLSSCLFRAAIGRQTAKESVKLPNRSGSGKRIRNRRATKRVRITLAAESVDFSSGIWLSVNKSHPRRCSALRFRETRLRQESARE